MTESLVPVSGRTTSAISESSQARGPSNLFPNDKRLRRAPNAEMTAEKAFEAQSAQLQGQIVVKSLWSSGLSDDGADEMTEHAIRVADAEAFLKLLKDTGTVDANGESHLADMTQAQKEALVTFKLPRFASRAHQRTNARRAIIIYADRYGHDAAMAFKDALLQPRRHWINGKRSKIRPFKFLGRISSPTKRDRNQKLILDRKRFTPENLQRMGDIAVLGEKLKSAGRRRPTLENVDRLLSQEDITALKDNDGLFLKDGGSAPIYDLLHVATYPWRRDRVSGSENRQKIRDVMLLATAKEAAAAKAENRGLDLEKLEALRADLLTAAKGGSQELANRYNEEMAKLAFQPGTPDAPGLSEIPRTSRDAKTYRAEFQASVKKWSKDNGHRFIALPKLQELSRTATAPILNKRKLDAHKAEVENGQDALLQDRDSKFKKDYLERMKNEVIKEGDKNGRILNDEQFNKLVWRTYNHVLYN